MICVICAVITMMMSGCLEVDDPVATPTPENEISPEPTSFLTPTPTKIELYYDSDSINGFRSMGNGIFPDHNSDGGNTNGFGMRFTTPDNTDFTIESILISGRRYGSDCNMRIEIWDDYNNVQYSNILKHSDVFTTVDTWGNIDIPNIGIDGDFYVVLFTDSINPTKFPTTGVYVNIDTSPEKNRMYTVNHGVMQTTDSENGVWMIRVIGTPSDKRSYRTPSPTPILPPAVPTTLELDIGHTAFNSQTEVTVISIHEKYYYEWMGVSGNVYSEEAEQGNTFVFAMVNMKNIGRSRDHLGAHDLSITDSEGFRYDRSYMSGDDNELEGFQELYKNQQMEGIVMFEIPKDAVGLKIQYDFGNIFGDTQIASWEIPDRG